MTGPRRTPDTGRIATWIVRLATDAVHARIDGATVTGVAVRRAGEPSPALSAVTGHPAAQRQAQNLLDGPSELAVISRSRNAGRPLAAEIDQADVPVGVRWVAAVALPEVGGALVTWLPHEPSQATLDALDASAPVVASAVMSAEQVLGLVAVPQTRLVIEQAKGVLMARHGVGPDEAFSLLTRLSQQANVPVRDLAVAVVATP